MKSRQAVRVLKTAVAAIVLLVATLVSSTLAPAADATPTCFGEPATIFSNAAVVHGTNGNDVIVGGPASQTIHGYDGDDLICGWSGNDTIHGNDGYDRINGGDGNDVLYGGKKADEINGGPGNDQLFGKSGADTLRGGADDDTIHGGYGNDLIVPAGGSDTVYGGSGDDILDAPGHAFPASLLEAIGIDVTDYDQDVYDSGSGDDRFAWAVDTADSVHGNDLAAAAETRPGVITWW